MTLIIDDEADYASVGYFNSKEYGIQANLTAFELDKLRKKNDAASFLQVTATPYSLYLQPENIELNGGRFEPVRPAFTVLVPVNPKYIGSDFYFEGTEDPDLLQYYLHYQLTDKELGVLRKRDARKLKLEDVLMSKAITGLRMAIVNFIVGGAILQKQNEKDGDILRKVSFLIHTEVSKASHEWQKDIVNQLYQQLRNSVMDCSDIFDSLIDESYKDLKQSVKINDNYLPSFEDVKIQIKKILDDEMLLIASVNSEQQVEDMLDDTGQLKLRAPLNIFIGGNILDRGITISNLIGFYYGRKPKQHQQDTVLQHCRMFGYRSKEELAVTRFYTEGQIYNAMKRMHESDVALREQLTKNDDQSVVFIEGSISGAIKPCSPNKIMLSNTTTLKPYKRLLPVGFQTENKSVTRNITKKIDKLLDKYIGRNNKTKPFMIDKKDALNIIDLSKQAIIMSEDEGYTFDWQCMKDAIIYMARDYKEIWCLQLPNRNNGRFTNPGSHSKYVSTPDTAKNEGRIAREKATEVPMLMLFRQNGAEKDGWKGEAFYWPLLYAAGNIKTTIYSNSSHSYED
ncbi:Z1 domain-containing protein [Xenorhabdus bovienii]|uniref:Z1 domain-containing protein n=1 Tax=Xenorhabdus bovienii TaxID=40576 RepID=UPI0004D515DC|nr:Z1 domain-containing protein [Xenorhabdus bovienii]CDG89870.1 conserved hypothetical protein [Xenorhabdus bovienii str. feltiae France]CDG91569.1 conserved hypothetical protein [Xenorhabdus bovienii str. feltiae Florida]